MEQRHANDLSNVRTENEYTTSIAVAKAEEARAKTTETLSKVSTTDQERIFALADRLTQPNPQMQ